MQNAFLNPPLRPYVRITIGLVHNAFTPLLSRPFMLLGSSVIVSSLFLSPLPSFSPLFSLLFIV